MLIGSSTTSAVNYSGACSHAGGASPSSAASRTGPEATLHESAQRQTALLQGAGFTSMAAGHDLNSGFPPFV